MVYLHFPQSLSEEELMLQTKYEKLKRKKKAVQNLKTPSRNDSDPRHHHHHHHHHHGSVHHHHHHHHGSAASHHHHQAAASMMAAHHAGSASSAAKRAAQVEARDAREVARKLIKSGAIAAIQKAPRREDQSAGFKRPCGLERKLERSDRPLSGYQPFSATQPDDFNNTGPIGGHSLDHDRPRIKSFESLASIRDHSGSGSSTGASGNASHTRPGGTSSGGGDNSNSNKSLLSNLKETPREGNTVFVTGNPISEQFLRTTFQDCGPIVNVTMEVEKNRGFVTFQSKESAAKAISVYHSCMVSSTQLTVTYARRQPPVDTMNGAHSAAAWSSAAANNSQKGSHKESRKKVDYSNVYFEWSEHELEDEVVGAGGGGGAGFGSQTPSRSSSASSPAKSSTKKSSSAIPEDPKQ